MTLTLEQVDCSQERDATRFLVAYSLRGGKRFASFDELAGPFEAFSLGRFAAHYSADASAGPRLFSASGHLDAVLGTDCALRLPVERVQAFGLCVRYSGYIALLQFDAQVGLAEAIALLQQTCFRRTALTIDGKAIERLLVELANPSVRPLLEGLSLDRDVYQLVLPGAQLVHDLARESGDDLDYAEDLVMRLVYREDAVFRVGTGSARAPAELNRPRRTLCRHGRGVTVLAGWPEHVEYAVALTAVELVSATARLRKIRSDTADALEVAEASAYAIQTGGTSGLSVARASLAGLSRSLGDLELQLSFGVEAYLDNLRVPEIVLESYRESFAASLGLAMGAATTGGMLSRLKTVIEARAAVLSAAEERVSEIRRRGWEWAAAYVSLVAIPFGLVLAFLGTSVKEVSPQLSLFDLHHYAWYYTAIFGTLLMALVVFAVVRLLLSRSIPKVLSEVE